MRLLSGGTSQLVKTQWNPAVEEGYWWKGNTLWWKGFIWLSDQLQWSPRIIVTKVSQEAAVKEVRRPESASAVCTFLGLVNFCTRFIPDLAITLEPLRKLKRGDFSFHWDKEQDRACIHWVKEEVRQQRSPGILQQGCKDPSHSWCQSSRSWCCFTCTKDRMDTISMETDNRARTTENKF